MEYQYQNVYFYLDSDYKHGRGYSSPEAKEAFHSEIDRLFTDAGWEIHPGESDSACETAHLGKSELYLHPMMASGVIRKDEIDAIKEILSGGTVFRLRDMRGFEEYADMGDDEYRHYLQGRMDEMKAAVLEFYRTKRKDLYRTGDTASTIARPFIIRRVQSKDQYEDLATQMAFDITQELIGAGQLVIAMTKHGLGIRAATRRELAQNADPGQVPMQSMDGPC